MNKLYKLEFETVLPYGGGAQFYSGEKPNCKPADVPDEFWRKSWRETDNPWQQYQTLMSWSESGDQLIRNVKLFEAQNEIEWKPVQPKLAHFTRGQIPGGEGGHRRESRPSEGPSLPGPGAGVDE